MIQWPLLDDIFALIGEAQDPCFIPQQEVTAMKTNVQSGRRLRIKEGPLRGRQLSLNAARLQV